MSYTLDIENLEKAVKELKIRLDQLEKLHHHTAEHVFGDECEDPECPYNWREGEPDSPEEDALVKEGACLGEN